MIFSILLMIFILTSCGGASRSVQSREDIFKGSDALVLNFLLNAPPSQVYEESPFRVAVDIKNNGANYDADGVLLIGYEEDYMLLEQNRRKYINIRGRSIENPFGEDEKFIFDFTSKVVDRLSTHHESVIFATACYEFKTFATSAVCIDTDLYDEREGEKII